jgi:tetratricopeptide (TPR) repeat protein
MDEMIARPDGTTHRLFPPISPNLYDLTEEPGDLTPDQQVARNLLALAKKDLSRWERYLGWKLDPRGQIGRLCQHHRMALEAELSGCERRAHLLWGFVHTQLKKLLKDKAVWEGLAAVTKQPEVKVSADPVALRQRLVDEIFIDTHCALYNGRIQPEEPLSLGNRAFVHLAYIENLLEFSALSLNDQLTLLAPAKDTQIRLYEELEQWERAIQVSAGVARKFPDWEPYQNRLASLVFSETLGNLTNGESEQKNLADAKKLEQGIQRLEEFRRDYPYNIIIFDVLAYLHYLQAIKLSNGKRVAEALVEVEKALTCNPNLKEAQEAAKQLTELMQNLQAQMEALEREIKYQPDKVLNAEGMLLKSQAKKGFKLLQDYHESDELKMFVNDVRLAHGRQIWKDIGLPELSEGWEERATTLLGALGEVFNNPPQDKAKVAAAWDEVAKKNSDLAKLDARLISTYLTNRLFGENADDFPQKPVLPRPANFPVLVATEKCQRDREPFGYWLFSKGDLGVKVRAGIAIILLMVVGGFAVRDVLHRNARSTAYQQITQAAAHNDYLTMIKAAEKFLENPVLSLKDEREQRIRELYDQAIVRWFAAPSGELDAAAQSHLKRYQALMVEKTGRRSRP